MRKSVEQAIKSRSGETRVGVAARAAPLVAVVAALVALVAVSATSAYAAASAPAARGEGASFRFKPSPISAAAAFLLPSSGRCLSQGELTLQLRSLPRVAWIGAVVKVNGSSFMAISRSQASRPVRIAGLPSGRIVLSITARASHGRSVTATRTYQTCAAKPGKPTNPTRPPRQVPQPAPVAPPQPAPGPPAGPPAPGSYTARTAGSPFYGFSLYVSTDGRQLQDVSLSGLGIRCAPDNGFFGDQFYVAEIAVAADGSFSSTTTRAGVIAGVPAQFTYTFSGHFHGYDSLGRARLAGSLRENVSYGNGVSYSCSSNVLPWSATRS